MRSRLVLLLLLALTGLGLAAYLGRGSWLRGGGSDPKSFPSSAGASEDVRLEYESTSAQASAGRVPQWELPSSSAESHEDGLQVHGLVLDPEGRPVPSAFVYWRPAGTRLAHDSALADGSSVMNGGRFGFELPLDLRGSVELWAEGDDWDASESIVLDRGELASGAELRLVLRRRGSVRGLALDLLGRPLVGRFVLLDTQDWKHRQDSGCAEVGSRGEFRLESVSSGSHQLNVVSDADPRSRVEEECEALAQSLGAIEAQGEVEVRSGLESSVILGGASPGGVRVHGRITRGGEPTPGALIWVEPGWSPGITRLAWTRCDEQGAYELGVEQPGSLRFHIGVGRNLASLVQRVLLPAQAEFPLDFELALGRIACRVIDSQGKPLAGQRVALVVHDSRIEARTPAAHAISRKSDEEGHVQFDSLAPGIYELRAGGGGLGRNGTGQVELGTGSAHEELVLVLGPACVLAGALLDAPDGKTSAGFVDVFDGRGSYVLRVRCDPDLHFRAEDLSEGKYRLCAHVGGLASPLSDPVLVTRSEFGWAELKLMPATEVFVRVLEPSGARLARYHESVCDTGGVLLSEGEVDQAPSAAGDAAVPEWIGVGCLPRGSFVLRVRTADGRSLEKAFALVGESRLELTLQLPAAAIAEGAR